MTIDAVLSDIATAAGFTIGQQYTAQQVIQRLLDQGRQHGDEKVVELLRERDKLQVAMVAAREKLAGGMRSVNGLSAFHVREIHTILSRALGFDAAADPDDFEAARRLAEQSAERD